MRVAHIAAAVVLDREVRREPHVRVDDGAHECRVVRAGPLGRDDVAAQARRDEVGVGGFEEGHGAFGVVVAEGVVAQAHDGGEGVVDCGAGPGDVRGDEGAVGCVGGAGDAEVRDAVEGCEGFEQAALRGVARGVGAEHVVAQAVDGDVEFAQVERVGRHDCVLDQ